MMTNSLVIQELTNKKSQKKQLTVEILKDYWICRVSRETSLMGRREVLTGKAKFGILGDGKEVTFLLNYMRTQKMILSLVVDK